MPPSIITELRQADPQGRAEIISNLYTKNLHYFARRDPAVRRLLGTNSGNPYQINITDEFLEIVHEASTASDTAGYSLDRFAEKLGDWSHQAWIEFLDPRLRRFSERGWHSQQVEDFTNAMLHAFPAFLSRLEQGNINLPTTGEERRFSNPVAFVGISHGLHIAHLLSRTDINHAVFIEPDPQRFELSCYFLDYEEIDKRFNGLVLFVGDELPRSFVDVMLRKAWVSSSVWLRILPGYASESIEPVIAQLRLAWLALNDAWVSSDRELRALRNGLNNLKSDFPLLVRLPSLSSRSRIAVVGAGPSLESDLAWLGQNCHNMIIFAAHAAVKTLTAHGICPDFQFSLDLEWDAAVKEKLGLDSAVPIVVPYQVDSGCIDNFKNVLLVAGDGIAAPVRVECILPFSQPTTGNMVLAFACGCRPSEILLLGMDFGFRQVNQMHVRGSHYDAGTVASEKIKGEEQLAVPANFGENPTVYTRPYFNQARGLAEAALASLPTKTTIYNLSDGALIAGAIAKHSLDFKLSSYEERHADIASIRASFDSGKNESGWCSYEVSGSDLLQVLKTELRETLSLSYFTWQDFVQILDSAQFVVNSACKRLSAQDSRMNPFLRIIKDLLVTWYRFLVFANSPEEIQLVYEAGFKCVQEIVERFEWPEPQEE